ncbi:M28 family peptidase [Marinoscillum sp.]|uniref:M28 family peptidase n=1 Tax=Marinoscillum sp. TaxID=2024838 RepID=UPI003BAD7DA9
MKHTTTLTLLLAVVLSGFAQDKKAQKFAKTISADDLKGYLSVLASDSLEGRETGERGQKMAAAYIAGKFKEFGLEPPVETATGNSYFQKYPLQKSTYRTAYLKKGDEKMVNFEDFVYFSRTETKGEEYVNIVYAGDETIESLKEKDLAGKFIAIPQKDMSNWRKVLADLGDIETEGIVLIVEDSSSYDFVKQRFSRYLSGTRLSTKSNDSGTKVIIGNPKLATWMFNTEYDQLEPGTASKDLILNSDLLIEDIEVENVLGFLEGTEKPEEVLVVTAHYDHIGIGSDGQVNNGADDDGSGTSTVIELAQAFSTAAKKGSKPRRSILFMTVSGEEKGLLGSEYYSNNPIFPLENTVTNLNVDMVGRIDPDHEENPNYVYVIGADKLSSELNEISEMVNKQTVNLDLDYTYNDENDPNRYYYRSDHYNFAKKNIPIIFYFNGTHADYHKPTDTIEKIDFKTMEKRALLVYYTAWELANRENRVKLD